MAINYSISHFFQTYCPDVLAILMIPILGSPIKRINVAQLNLSCWGFEWNEKSDAQSNNLYLKLSAEFQCGRNYYAVSRSRTAGLVAGERALIANKMVGDVYDYV